MDNMVSLLGLDEGSFLFPHIFLCQLLPLVHAALLNSPCLAAGDFCDLADQVLLYSRHFSIHGMASDTLQLAAED